nr:(+)-neomenthol dehydrogenase [Quercus suber]
MRYAVVTGANKGIGFEICRKLASNGIVVVLTARDEKKGLEAVGKLRKLGLSDHVVFHQLDVADPASTACFVDFIKTIYGKLDILVNNAKITGSIVDKDVLAASVLGMDEESANVVVDWSKIATDTYELAEECLKTNYSGAKGMIEALLPILQLSNSPRIVNVSSSFGHLKEIPSEWAKEVLGNAEILTEERVDEVLNEYLKDFKEGSLETKDINHNPGYLTTNEGAERVVKLALLPNDGPSGLFFSQNELTNFD